MNLGPRQRWALRGLFYACVLALIGYHIAAFLAKEPLSFEVKGITVESDGTHLLHYELRNKSPFTIDLSGGGGRLCLPGYKRRLHWEEQTGMFLARSDLDMFGRYVALRPGESITSTMVYRLRLLPGQELPHWCHGAYFEYAYMPRISRQLGKPLSRFTRWMTEGTYRELYVEREVQIPVILPVPEPSKGTAALVEGKHH